MIEEQVLGIANVTKPFELETNASNYERTYAFLKEGYFWPNMRDDVMKYTKTCLFCQQDKVKKAKVARLLKPLPAPQELERVFLWTSTPISQNRVDNTIVLQTCCKVIGSPDKHHELGSAAGCGRILFQCLNELVNWEKPIQDYIARAYLEKASKRMKKWVDKKHRPLEFRVSGIAYMDENSSSNSCEQPKSPNIKIMTTCSATHHLTKHRSKSERRKRCLRILTDQVRKGRRPTRRIHKYLVRYKNLPVEETSWECVDDLEA
ncbi:reverse transcriptase [Cucumis melo var. makuwa]|uniref:Reverse transcriptase n=1 Tax=Cucumis melo var. makuwa TaxID=1194695 RepID=A0A5D3C135_CUCMM|nr:reverse transcriptase [Cucumis melo var. makuwa]